MRTIVRALHYFARVQICWVLFLALHLFFLSGARGGYEKSNLEREFMIEAPAKTKIYSDFAERLQGEIELEQFNVKEDRLVSTSTVRFKQNARCVLYMFHAVIGKTRQARCAAINPRYGFVLTKPPKSNQWAISAIDLEKKDARFVRSSSLKDDIRAHTMVLYTVSRLRLDQLISDRRFRLSNVSSTKENGRILAKIQFDFTHPVTEEPFIPCQGGTLYVDPARNWCIVKQRLKIKGTRYELIEKESRFINVVNGVPICTESVWTQHDSQTDKLLYKATSKYKLRPADSLPHDDEFVLSAFGLPEPFITETKTTPWYIWAAGAGILCIVAGVAFHWYKRRSN